MKASKESLARQALNKALEVRRGLKIPANHPIDVYEVCKHFDLTVQFLQIPGGEGMYWREEDNVRIFISSLRPIPRKAFTCGHELGHHLFGHGSSIDKLHQSAETTQFEPEEFLADCFSGFLLMPKLAVQSAFSSRGWNPEQATPIDFFTISCSLGVGYTTLINHMTYSLRMIGVEKAKQLKKSSPKLIRTKILEYQSSGSLMIVDEKFLLKSIDVETRYQILLPKNIQVDGSAVKFQAHFNDKNLFTAESPGISRVYCSDTGWAAFIRVSNAEYQGLSEYRHIEECDDE